MICVEPLIGVRAQKNLWGGKEKLKFLSKSHPPLSVLGCSLSVSLVSSQGEDAVPPCDGRPPLQGKLPEPLAVRQ